jgi:hypothetical protein
VQFADNWGLVCVKCEPASIKSKFMQCAHWVTLGYKKSSPPLALSDGGGGFMTILASSFFTLSTRTRLPSASEQVSEREWLINSRRIQYRAERERLFGLYFMRASAPARFEASNYGAGNCCAKTPTLYLNKLAHTQHADGRSATFETASDFGTGIKSTFDNSIFLPLEKEKSSMKFLYMQIFFNVYKAQVIFWHAHIRSNSIVAYCCTPESNQFFLLVSSGAENRPWCIHNEFTLIW